MIVEWDATKERFGNGSLLLGNGASQAVWKGFGYQSLFARASDMNPGLNDDGQAVFKALGTQDFERVLRGTQTTVQVLDALGFESNVVKDLHTEIRDALIAAVQSVHLPWDSFQGVVGAYRAALENHDWLFSTNYDLLVYWTMMHGGGAGFKDAFWGTTGTFDRRDADFWDECVKVVYLHGGLHLERDSAGRARKRDTTIGSLLDTFGPDLESQTTPLFVSEGSAEEKIRVILQSEYLAWALESLELLEGPIVLFGSALGSTDEHIVQAVNRSPCDPVGVSVYTHGLTDSDATVKWLEARLPHKRVIAFDSSTHPLGDEGLVVQS